MKKIFIILSFVFGLLYSQVSLGYSSTDVSNASFLADQGIIVKQSVAANYRLDSTITRAEAIGIALKIKGITLPEKYTCKNYFTDVKYDATNNWKCRAIELAADAGLISRTNTKFRPSDTITKVEALAIIMKSGGMKIQSGIGVSEGFLYLDNYENYAENWQLDVMETARKLDFISPKTKTASVSFSGMQGIYTSYYWNHNSSATRAEVFEFAKNILGHKTAEASGEMSIFHSDDLKVHFLYPKSWANVSTLAASLSDYLPSNRTFIAIYPDIYPASDFSGRIDIYSDAWSNVWNHYSEMQGNDWKSTSELTINNNAWTIIERTFDTLYLTEKNGKVYVISGDESSVIQKIIKSFTILGN